MQTQSRFALSRQDQNVTKVRIPVRGWRLELLALFLVGCAGSARDYGDGEGGRLGGGTASTTGGGASIAGDSFVAAGGRVTQTNAAGSDSGGAASSPPASSSGGQSVMDLCSGVTCSNHGTCSSGACVCAPGYDGPGCDRCAPGYGIYPVCTQCTCTLGSLQCDGSSAIEGCPDGCHWLSQSCATECAEQTAISRSSGCAYDWNTKRDSCWCPKQVNHDVMLWTFRDAWDDGVGQNVGLYDVTARLEWGPYFLQKFNANLSTSIECTTGDKICWGAWQGSYLWGCGEECTEPCTDCCHICGSVLTTPTKILGP